MAALAAPPWRSPALPILIGVSACLLGEAVRYDGGHQKDGYLTGVLARHFSWLPVCPEHVNMLQHIMGFFKARLSPGEKRERLGLIGDYGRGLFPLIVPVTLVNH